MYSVFFPSFLLCWSKRSAARRNLRNVPARLLLSNALSFFAFFNLVRAFIQERVSHGRLPSSFLRANYNNPGILGERLFSAYSGRYRAARFLICSQGSREV